MEKSYYDGFAYVYGIKSRCRKSERHQIKLGEFSLDTQIKDIAPLIVAKVTASMKTHNNKIDVRLNHITEIDNGSGFISKQWQPFSDKELRDSINCTCSECWQKFIDHEEKVLGIV